MIKYKFGRLAVAAIQVITFGGVAATYLGTTAPNAFAAVFDSKCNSQSSLDDYYKRSEARSYALVGRYEGYQWGGGCWNNNDKDDQPGDPPETLNTGGEGGDCSGFVFKSWDIKSNTTTAFKYYDKMNKIHGDYDSSKWMVNSTAWTTESKSYASTELMDVFASTGHIAMIYAEGTSNNSDTMLEAKSERLGTILATETYRGQTNFKAAHRNGWTNECWPKCQ